MKNTKKNDLSDRRSAATDAKAARLQAYQAAKEAAAPHREARQIERMALAEAREGRKALRVQAKLEEQARHEAEMIAQDAAKAASASEGSDLRDQADNDRVARVIEDEAARKAERDRRYANRKARKA